MRFFASQPGVRSLFTGTVQCACTVLDFGRQGHGRPEAGDGEKGPAGLLDQRAVKWKIVHIVLLCGKKKKKKKGR